MDELTASQFIQRLQAGDRCHDFFMRTIDNKVLEPRDFRGRKYWIAFYRYAGCPVCATHFAQVIEAKQYMEDSGITFIAVYDCQPQNVPTWIRKNLSDSIHVVADSTQMLHAKFGSEKSWKKLFSVGSVAARLKAATEGYVEQKLDGSMNLMPAHILVSEEGTVAHAHYSSHPGDHINWKTVRDFASNAIKVLREWTNPSYKMEVMTAPEASSERIAADDEVSRAGILQTNLAARADFTVLYKWKVSVGREADFLKIWKDLEASTKQLYPTYLGARLHLDSDQYMTAYAVWSTKTDWEKYWITKEQSLSEFIPLSLCIERTFEPQFFRSIYDSLSESVRWVEPEDEKTVLTSTVAKVGRS